jgi:hypothetical protein
VTRRLAAALCLLVPAALAGGCAGGADPEEVLATSAQRFGEVRSGELELRVLATPDDRRDRGIGFQLTGPFSLEGDTPLPVARMRFTRIAGEQRSSAVLTSTGEQAFVTVDGVTTPLDETRAQALALPAGPDRPRTLETLGIDILSWLEDPEAQDGPQLDGVATDRVTGDLRTGRAVRDVLSALRRGGAAVPEPTDGLVQRIDAAVAEADVEVVAGREDGVPRRMSFAVTLRPTPELETALPGGGAVRLTARLDLRRPNSSVEVRAPEQ